MTEFAALMSRPAQSTFLGEQDLRCLRRQAEEIDAAYGEALDALAPAVLARLTERPHAA